MSFFRRFFGPKPDTPSPSPAGPPALPPSEHQETPQPLPLPKKPATHEAAAQIKDPVVVYDKYGREARISHDDWFNVLWDNIRENWNDPEKLSGLLINAFGKGFFAQVEKAALQLHRIDPRQDRSVNLLAIVYLQTNRPGDAQRLLSSYLQQHGEEAATLVNLAKALSLKGEDDLSLRTLWRALELDPNLDHGLEWYELIHNKKGGGSESIKALTRVAALPGSWRAQAWLARYHVRFGSKDKAIELYQQSLAAAGSPAPDDLLKQISGDLGIAGHIPDILNLVAPHFDPKWHGIAIGNNLLKANLDLGRIDAARALLNQLHSQQRPAWRETLDFWENELTKLDIETRPAISSSEADYTFLSFLGPVWRGNESPLISAIPPKSKDCSLIAFWGSSVEYHTRDAPPGVGRISRALPLFLAEYFAVNTDASTRTIIPWITNAGGAFVLRDIQWEDSTCCENVRLGTSPADWVVILHLNVLTKPWVIELRCLRTIDGHLLGTAKIPFHLERPSETLIALTMQVHAFLAEEAALHPAQPPKGWKIPQDMSAAHWLTRIEQCLVARCCATKEIKKGTLIPNPAEIIEGSLNLCLTLPEHPGARFLLCQILHSFSEIDRTLAASYLPRAKVLNREHPLPEPLQSLVDESLALLE